VAGICTSAIILAQYLMITFRRGTFLFSREVWWQIGAPGLIAVLISPVVFYLLHWIARATFPYLPGKDRFE
jgi:hypothetical protein